MKNKFNWNGDASRSIWVCVMYGQLSLLEFRWSVVSQNQSLLQIDLCVMHLSVCHNFFRVRHSPSILRLTLQRSRQRIEIGQHLCIMFASLHLCRIFAACFGCILAVLHLWLHFWLHLLLLECFAASRVPSLTTLVALGRTRLLATPGFTELHKAPYFQKCPSSKKNIDL